MLKCYSHMTVNEKSSLLRCGIQASDKHQHAESCLSYRAMTWAVLHFRSSIVHTTALELLSEWVELFLLVLIVANVIVILATTDNFSVSMGKEGIADMFAIHLNSKVVLTL